jgi:hypothetical protein
LMPKGVEHNTERGRLLVPNRIPSVDAERRCVPY